QMATIRFGPPSSPCREASAAEQAEENEEKIKWDPDKLQQCPYDKNHQIRACRFPYHLIKCRKNHPKLARELKTCPYNARHLVHKHELAHHTETCENRMRVYTEDAASTDGNGKWEVPVSTWVNPIRTEDWDQETDDYAAPFVWGVNTQETRPTNNLGPSFRAPNTLPWLD
uniref:Gametocyte-specific factor 1-like n=1 Tax=Stegastes partitus TaxID=144197 RepID=A0A3B5B8B8_9TELE